MCPVSLLNYAKEGKKKKGKAHHAIGWRAARLRPRARDTAEESELTGRCLRVPSPSPAVPRLSGEFVREFTWVTLMEAKPQGESVSLHLPAAVFSCCFPAPCKTQHPSPHPTVTYRWEGLFVFVFFKWRQLWSDRRHVSFLVRKVFFFFF